MFGYSDTYIRRWFEPDLLASLRFLTVGQMAFHLVDPSELNKALKKWNDLERQAGCNRAEELGLAVDLVGLDERAER